MTRDRKDRCGTWIIDSHGDSLLRLAKVTGFTSWRPSPAVLSFPKQMPDGLLDVTFPGRPAPDPFLIEIESYPAQDTIAQLRDDAAMVLLTRGVLPNILLVVLFPKGNLRIDSEQVLQSSHGLSEWRLKITVVNLWTIPAEELLAANDVGLIPLVPLTSYTGSPDAILGLVQDAPGRVAEMLDEIPPAQVGKLRKSSPQHTTDKSVMTMLQFANWGEKSACRPPPWREPGPILQQCAEHIHSQASANETGNLLAATRVMAETRYNKVDLLRVLGEHSMKWNELFETAPSVLRVKDAAVRDITRKHILRRLEKRFGTVAEDLAAHLRTIDDQDRLEKLLDVADDCPEIQAFRAAISDTE